MTDSRSAAYIAEHGHTCWEVDALKPEVLRNIVDTNIAQYIDVDLYQQVCEQESEEKLKLKEIIENLK